MISKSKPFFIINLLDSVSTVLLSVIEFSDSTGLEAWSPVCCAWFVSSISLVEIIPPDESEDDSWDASFTDSEDCSVFDSGVVSIVDDSEPISVLIGSVFDSIFSAGTINIK